MSDVEGCLGSRVECLINIDELMKHLHNQINTCNIAMNRTQPSNDSSKGNELLFIEGFKEDLMVVLLELLKKISMFSILSN